MQHEVEAVASSAPSTGITHASLVDRGRRLFEFLAQAQRLKATPVYTTSQYDETLWFADLPVHHAVTSAHWVPEPSEAQALLTVDRVPAHPAPEVPAGLEAWLEGAINRPDSEPRLKEAIPNRNATAEDGSDAVLTINDHPGVRELHSQWLRRWEAWSEQEQIDRPVRELYKALFATFVKLGAHPEQLELVLGVGLLTWKAGERPVVSRHVLTSPASVVLDETSGRIAISAQPVTETLTLELDMLDPSLVPNPGLTNGVRDSAREFGSHPLHRASVGDLVRRLVHALHADASYVDENTAPTPTGTPQAAFAPAIILRKRTSLGLAEVFATIAAEIAAADDVPAGLVPLLDPNQQPRSELDATPGGVVTLGAEGVRDGADGDPSEVFLPLPLNQVQLDIIRRVDRSAQTLVQGPPGTGKTHTAAALLTHLLAQGKRVLVTAQTDRALKEVRGKLPETIKPLAVAVVGSDQSDMADLKVAVARISSYSSEHNPRAAADAIEACLQNIDKFRRQRAELRGRLLEARATEVEDRRHAGYEGTLSKIAQRYQSEAELHDWLTQFTCPGSEEECPLTSEDALRWLTLVRDLSIDADTTEASQHFPSTEQLPDPNTFADLIDAEARGAAGAAAHSGLWEHDAYKNVAQLPESERAHLQSRMRELARRASELEERDESWLNAALSDIRTGRRIKWQARADDVRTLVAAAEPDVQAVGVATEITVVGRSAEDYAGIARQLLAHVRATGDLKTLPDGTPKVGMFSPAVVKAAKPFFDDVRVNRRTPVTEEQLSTFLAFTEAERQLDLLDRAWPQDITIPQEDTVRERLLWHVTELEQLDRLLSLSTELELEERRLANLDIAKPDWNDIASVLTYAHLVDAAAAAELASASAQPLESLASLVAKSNAWQSAAPVTAALHAAVLGRDRDAYDRAYRRIERLLEVQLLLDERGRLFAALASGAHDLADAVLADPGRIDWENWLRDLPAAWDWSRTGAWILEQETVDTNVIQAQISALEGRVRRETEVLASTRAWNHAVAADRLTGTARADLTQYAQLVKSLGKGTGKYAAMRRTEIRGAMDRCRPAVPVWILPIYRIAEQLRVHENMFDVVIVDEASQAGLEAAFLQYLAPKIVIIGDDKQVSPAAVGVDQQQLRDLANQYLYDDRYIASWQDPKRSLFDDANMRFGDKLTLIEHRRCVPEIIGFSNRIAYEPDNIRLLPVRQYGAERLDPIKAVHVVDGYERGTSGNKTNPAEIDAIVEQLQKCFSDPRYDGMTFGVISLSGSRQARMIEAELIGLVPPEEWSARELRCGDAADFQGSERDVILLSMVAAPEEGQRMGALTQEMYVQRFNVAASRAKDQLWLFHSITLSQVPNSNDMRHHLLDYCYGIIGRSRESAAGSEPVPDDILTEPFDSLLEQRVFNRIVDRGFTVIPQFAANGYNLDLVVVGAKGRLAIECDGDAWHGPAAYEADLGRQRDLERCGWQFFRIRESAWYVDQHAVLEKLWETLESLDIRPSDWIDDLTEEEEAYDGGADVLPSGILLDAPTTEVQNPSLTDNPEEAAAASRLTDPSLDPVPQHYPDDLPEEAPHSVLPSVAELLHVEAATPNDLTPEPHLDLIETHAPGVAAVTLAGSLSGLELPEYQPYRGLAPNPLTAPRHELIDTLCSIVEAEGPVVGFRIHHVYVVSAGGQRVGKQIASALNVALSDAVRRGVLVEDNPLNEPGIKPRTFRLPHTPAVVARRLGPRSLDEVPPLELAEHLRQTAVGSGWDSREDLFRQTLHRLGRGRLSGPAQVRLEAVLPLASLEDD